MDRTQDPFIQLAADCLPDGQAYSSPHDPALLAPAVGRLQGFDLLEQPLVANLAARPGRVLAARCTVPLRRDMVGREVLVVFDDGDAQSPIIMGVIEPHPLFDPLVKSMTVGESPVEVTADGMRRVIEAERELVLRCGQASITLTRAGKVLIKGSYILSRSSGYNKIKGAAVDIN